MPKANYKKEDQQTGVVKWFSDEKGYGFIVPDAGGPEVFVHWRGILGKGHRALSKDQHVQFYVTHKEGKPKPEADLVQVVV